MSLYNILNGVSINAFLVFPMLGYGHPQIGEFPRFRDCFVNPKNQIEVYSRMGGGNRECWNEGKENCDCFAHIAEKIEREDSNFISRVDDDFDETYCTFTFRVPEKWKKDFELVIAKKFKETSQEYKELVLNLLTVKETIEFIKNLFAGLTAKDLEGK